MKDSSKLLGALVLSSITAAAGLKIGYIIGRSSVIPKIDKVQQGFIAPSRLEITCEDTDDSDKPETIVRIDHKPFYLKEINGNPVLEPYKPKQREDY